jgi:hypothetical protein
MRKLLAVVFAVCLLSLVATLSVSAQTPPPFTTAFAVQNLGTVDAHVVVQWFTEEGSLVYTSPDVVIAPGGLGNYSPGTGLPASWSGSVVISADQPIAAIANTTDNFGVPTYWGGSEGLSSAATGTSVYLPFALRSRSGRTSTIGVQNAGGSTANVYINFKGHSSSPIDAQVVKSLNAGASTILNLGADVAGLGSNWMGSVAVTSTMPLAASSLDVGANLLYNYSGVAAASTDLVLPFVVGARSNQDTAHALLNPSGVLAHVTITYTGNIYGVPSTTVISRDLQPNELWNQLHSAQTGNGFLGSAVIHSDLPVLGIVNQTYGSFGASGKKMAYTMIDASKLTPKISLPYVLRERSSKRQGIIIQNAGAVDTTLYVSFTPLAGGGNGNPSTYTKSVPAGQFYNFGTNYTEWDSIGNGAYGTMVVTNTANVNIVAIVNTWNTVVSESVDSLGSYIATNY